MRPEQWQIFKKAAKREPDAGTPVALIVDSPWMPGYFGIGTLEYFLDPELWFQCNKRLIDEFPGVIMIPSWWMEYGMAIEPSAYGNRIHFWTDQPPGQTHTLKNLEDAANLPVINPQTDGFMALALARYRMQKQRIFDSGYTIPMVAARGPLCLASFLRGVSELMMDIVENPEATHVLLDKTTTTVIDWLKAQAEAIGDSVEGFLVLDDIAGFLSARAYREFAAPYLKRICDAFPANWVKVYHNDANTRPFLGELPDCGFDVLNWSHKVDISEALAKTGDRITYMGNVAPLDIGVRGTPEQVLEHARAVLEKSGGKNLILSLGGGASPGMPKANVEALAAAAAAFGK